MAATNKCLAQSNKSGTRGEATKKRDAAHRAPPQHRQEGQARALPMERMTEHDMIGWFNAAPMCSRQQRMLWAAHKIARLTGATAGSVYQMLERSLDRAEPPPSGKFAVTTIPSYDEQAITPPPIAFVLDALGTTANAAGTLAPSTVMNATVLPSPTSLPGSVSFGSNTVLSYGSQQTSNTSDGSTNQQTSNTSAGSTS